MLEKRTDAKPVALPAIIVRQSALDDPKAYALPCAVVDFVNHTLHRAKYERGEIPVEAMQVFHVDYYVAQVNNGGHSQFVGNSGWHDYMIEDIRNGLKAIGLAEAQELFEDLCTFADTHPDEFMQGMKACGFGEYPEFFKKADQIFYAGLNTRLTEANTRWARSLACLNAVPDAQYREIMDGIAARNPVLDLRKEEREFRAQASLDMDPVFRACQFIGRRCDPPVEVARWLSGNPLVSPEGVRGAVFQVETHDGRQASIALFPTYVQMTGPGSDKPHPRIPIEPVQEWTMGCTGQFLPRELWG